MKISERIVKSLRSKCEADKQEALLTLDLCFERSAAIGEHTSEHFFEEAFKALDKLAAAEDRMGALDRYVRDNTEDSLV